MTHKAGIEIKEEIEGDNFAKEILAKAQELYVDARSNNKNPDGWVLGKSIVDVISDYYAKNNYAAVWDVERGVKQTLIGLDYFIDTENRDRLELIT